MGSQKRRGWNGGRAAVLHGGPLSTRILGPGLVSSAHEPGPGFPQLGHGCMVSSSDGLLLRSKCPQAVAKPVHCFLRGHWGGHSGDGQSLLVGSEVSTGRRTGLTAPGRARGHPEAVLSVYPAFQVTCPSRPLRSAREPATGPPVASRDRTEPGSRWALKVGSLPSNGRHPPGTHPATRRSN